MKGEISYLSMAAWMHRVTEPAVRPAICTLQLPAGSRGLDAGCGIGTHTLWLAEVVSPGGHVTGIDISRECLAHAEETAAKNGLAEQVSFQYGDLGDLPFDDNAFDWTWNADTLWPVAGKAPLPLVRELARVVRPGGILAILFWSSQRLLPGYPLLEARLNATCAANFPYTADTKPEWHILRTPEWLQEASLNAPQARTFVADIHAPLADAARNALAGSFQMLWGESRAGSHTRGLGPVPAALPARIAGFHPESPRLLCVHYLFALLGKGSEVAVGFGAWEIG